MAIKILTTRLNIVIVRIILTALTVVQKNAVTNASLVNVHVAEMWAEEGAIEINIFGFNTSGFTYVLSQGGKSIERAVSFSVFGIDFNSDGILPHPRTISGIVRRDGTIPSG
ncbi:hypothetical protein LSPH26S_02685 [Lysinibacillus sphaericus]